jgi:SAM-dependent MidA family methyltransferase
MRIREAMQRALYGPDGFYVRHRPARHFRTSSQSPVFAGAIARLVGRVDAALGEPSTVDVVDVGAGEGSLLRNLGESLPPDLRARVRLRAVELGDPVIPDGIVGVLLAMEWLDNVPLDLARDGVYLDDGAPLSTEDAEWVARWWPDPEPGRVVEIGRTRDEAWAFAVAQVQAGLAVAVDYGHLSGTRPAHTTLAAFRDGREVDVVFDGSADITCHVALDSAGSRAGARYHIKRQREWLKALGVDGGRPPLDLARSDPSGYVRALAAASEAGTLLDPSGLGGHWWLTHEVGIRLSE